MKPSDFSIDPLLNADMGKEDKFTVSDCSQIDKDGYWEYLLE